MKFIEAFFAALFVMASPVESKEYSLTLGDQDVTIYHDAFPHGAPLAAAGDFNGDGYDDVAIAFPVTIGADEHHEIDILRGGPFSTLSRLTDEQRFRVTFNGFAFPNAMALGDVNNDGKDDLIVTISYSGWSPLGVFVFLGRSDIQTLNLDQANIKIVSSSPSDELGDSLATGDFDGDGIDDLVLGAPSMLPRPAVCFLKGRRTLEEKTLWTFPGEADTTIIVKTAFGGGFYSYLRKGHLTTATKDDLILSDRYRQSGAAIPQEISVFGNGPWPRTWDLDFTSATVTVAAPEADHALICLGVEDVTGDGKDDLHIVDGEGHFLMEGRSLSGLSTVPLDGTITLPLESLPFSSDGPSYTMADLDGDGRADLVSNEANRVNAFLSSDYPRDTLPAIGDASLTLHHDGSVEAVVAADMNGDGIADLVTTGSLDGDPPSGWPVYGMTTLWYGFRPLADPFIKINIRSAETSRVDLALDVGGDPAELQLSGDLLDAFKDHWVPYQPTIPVTLTSSTGTKTVSVLFRNQFRHGVSDPANHSVSLLGGDMVMTMSTNHLGQVGSVVLGTCRLSERGRLYVRIFSMGGIKIRTLMDAEVGPGYYPIEWDGTDSEGRLLPPGAYLLMVEANGRVEKNKILVEK